MRRLLLLLVLAATLPASPTAAAGESRPSLLLPIADQVSLGAVLRRIGERYPGRALGAHTVERDGRLLYRIKWLGADGKVRDIVCDARTGEILRVR